MRYFSEKNRPTHLGPYPLEFLTRRGNDKSALHCPDMQALEFHVPERPHSIINAMREHQAMLDAIRDGLTNKSRSQCPEDLTERANHLKSFAYFADASMAGACRIDNEALLDEPIRNPDIDRLAEDLRTRQTKTLAAGIDLIMADLRDSMNAPPSTIDGHTHALVFLYEYPRDPDVNEHGTDWIVGAQAHRACLLASETAVVLANYIRLLGFDARAHSATTSDVNLNRLAIDAGLATVEQQELVNPYLGSRFGIGVVTTTFEMACDKSLAALADQDVRKTHGLSWKLGKGFVKGAMNHVPYAKRRYVDGAHPFETLKRVDTPTTFIDEARVARVPKRTDMFARANFGDMGKALQAGAKGGKYVSKAAPSAAQRRALGAFVLLQDGVPNDERTVIEPQQASDLIKATSYFLGADAMGISRCPEWSWYSHDARGEPIIPTQEHAISMVIDQGYSTMEGSSGDDWIAVSQSMRAYLRFSLLGSVVAQQIRNLGYSARAHTVLDGEVLQPPLLLLAGLGEVSRIGEVILNPFLGPRLKSGAITTDMPLAHDKPIDFGLQRFCESCNKCARECPSGAITAGPKLMFNGYEIWKSDSQKCATYRITTPGGAMCGRCMKTCPWNLEGLFKEKPFRWAAMNIPASAPALAKLDDLLGNGSLNPIKKWWWDLEVQDDGSYRPTDKPVNARTLQKDLHLKYEDQTLAVYPANLAPHPYPYPYPMDREKGIEAYQAMITAEAYKAKLANGDTEGLAHVYTADGESPVIQVELVTVENMTDDICKYEFQTLDGSELPAWEAGAHLDIVVAPEYLRQYSMSGDPADRSKFQIGVLREDEGRGGSVLMHRIFTQGRKLFVSRPINHFGLNEQAEQTVLFGGGIGITPLIAMAHRLHAINANFVVHYSGSSRTKMAYLSDMAGFAWSDKVRYHVSDEGSRADFDAIFSTVCAAAEVDGTHVYTCGAERYMSAVLEAAKRASVPDENQHLEYFSVPETPDWVNEPFKLKLAKSGLEFDIPADKSATDVLLEQGINIDVKCSDGLCGVCKCGLVEGDVEHRDFVLSSKQREGSIILCQSRALEKDGVVVVDL